MRHDGDLKARTRADIIRAASAVMRRFGPDRLLISELMASVGLPHGEFYAHFRSRDELISEAIAWVFDDNFAKLFIPVADMDPHAALTSLTDRYLSMKHRNDAEAGCPLPVLVAKVPSLPKDAQDAFHAGCARVAKAMSGHLEGLDVADAEALAESVMAEMAGSVAMARAIREDGRAAALLDRARASVKARLGIA